MKILSFDIEIANVFDVQPGEDLDQYGPFDIAVAATAIHQGEEKLWFSKDRKGTPAAKMSKKTATEMLRYLREMQEAGYHIFAWNGLSFDLRWLGHVSGQWELACEVARQSYDPMFQFFNDRGFPVGLAKATMAMGIDQVKLMEGAEAPRRWAAGEHQLVMDYVLGDCQMTNKLVLALMEMKGLSWITARGVMRHHPMPLLKTVEEVLCDPEPDQSWMDTPLRREKFCGWLENGALGMVQVTEVM